MNGIPSNTVDNKKKDMSTISAEAFINQHSFLQTHSERRLILTTENTGRHDRMCFINKQKICTLFECIVLTSLWEQKKNVAHIRLAFHTFCFTFNFMCILKSSAIGCYCVFSFIYFVLCHQIGQFIKQKCKKRISNWKSFF